ncbi:hypothetical protein [Phenylobacterium sp.]|jgi:hypothetical protein|uniref:hypothetical protein n=1 Tax=Phenylobacterium sp. TaxID=1871053 RepID=UPI00121E41B7|nr:hypothetical protein [Phenylobacterium sp.]THD65544.1 MAG: hypothetical protein E8A12_06875 [Phenylobacterium sp.]
MTTDFCTETDVDRVGLGLIYRSLPKAEWTHAAHFAAALWLLRHRPDWRLAERMPPLIRAYNEATGVENSDSGGYHETITQASLAAAGAVLASHPPDRPLNEIVDALMAGPLGRSDWPLAYWSKDRLFSVEARRVWIEPDLQAFDPRAFTAR